MSSPLQITRAQEFDGRTVLTIRGEVEAATAPTLRTALTGHLAAGRSLVLDVSGAWLADPAGLRVLVAAQARAAGLGAAPIALRGVRPRLAESLRAAGLERLFPRESAPAPGPTRAAGPGAPRPVSV